MHSQKFIQLLTWSDELNKCTAESSIKLGDQLLEDFRA